MLIYRPSDKQSRLAFSSWDEIVIDGVAFRTVDETDKGFVLVRVDGTGVAEFFEHATLFRRADAGLLTHNREKFRPAHVVQEAHSTTDLLTTLSDEAQQEVRYRLSMVDAANELHAERLLKRDDKSIKANMHLIRERATQMLEMNAHTDGERLSRSEVMAGRVGASTLRKWLKKHDNGGICALVDKRHLRGNRKRQMNGVPKKICRCCRSHPVKQCVRKSTRSIRSWQCAGETGLQGQKPNLPHCAEVSKLHARSSGLRLMIMIWI